MRRLLTWAVLVLATLLWVTPAAAQLPTCTASQNPFPLSGGTSLQVLVNGVARSNHTSLGAALGRMLLLQVAWPDSVVRVRPDPGGEYSVACLPAGVAAPPPVVPPPPPPPPPPPAPVAPWVIELVEVEVVPTDTLRAVVTVRVVRRDGSPVAGALTRWSFISSAGTTTAERVTGSDGQAARGWIGQPGQNTAVIRADSADGLTLTRSLGGVPDALQVEGFLLVPETVTVPRGQSVTFCGLIVFADGKIARRAEDSAPACALEYSKVPAAVRTVTAAQQARADSVRLCVEVAGGGTFAASAYCGAPTDMEGVRVARLPRPRWFGSG